MSDPDPTIEQPPYLDDDEEWVSEVPKGLRIPAATGILLLLLFAGLGLWGGSVLQKHHDKARSTSTAAAAFAGGGAARRAAAAAGAGAGAGAGPPTGTATGGSTSGIVTDITGSTVSITDASGNLVTITLSPSSTITKSAAATPADLKLGQTIVVRGTKGADGSTAASSVVISPADPTTGGTSPAGTGGG